MIVIAKLFIVNVIFFFSSEMREKIQSEEGRLVLEEVVNIIVVRGPLPA